MAELAKPRIILGISGASGAIYARRTLQLLVQSQVHVHLVISPLGTRLLHDELEIDPADPLSMLPPEADRRQVTFHAYRDVGASIASGSFQHDGMAIVPCSSHTLSCVALGQQENLLHRAAAVCLKERRRLVLIHRESPLSLADIRNMESATLAGAIICPANPGFYLKPQTIDQLVDHVVARVLDLLKIDHPLSLRWPPPPSLPPLPPLPPFPSTPPSSPDSP